jgi:DnaJ-class molecular chaperone
MTRVHTHYDNLKVTRDAPPEVIRAAYRSLCHRFHPDRHGGSARATQTFQLINRAYEVLSDPQRRLQHDAWIALEEAGLTPSATASAMDGTVVSAATGAGWPPLATPSSIVCAAAAGPQCSGRRRWHWEPCC